MREGMKASKATQKTPKAAKRGESDAYRRGEYWEMRRRYQGYDLYVSGHSSKAAARKAIRAKMTAIDEGAKPAGLGASRTTFAQALQDYALERLPYLKGADQEARRINNYLRAAGLRLLKVTKCQPDTQGKQVKTGVGAYHEVELVAHTDERVIPQGLGTHRKALLTENARTEKLRAVLAGTAMSEVSRSLLQKLVFGMMRDRNAPATIANERAVWRVLFNWAHDTWHWWELQDNPASGLKMPKVDNDATRILSEDEERLMDEALHDCRNVLVEPTAALLLETGMRASEPLEHATWADVNWDEKILTLQDSKTGRRDVPLSPRALQALETLRALGTGEPDERVVRISYEALRAAWKRACERAGIKELNLHALRHTAATRMALKTGNMFLVMALTGHKHPGSVKRYVKVRAKDVVKVMHAKPDVPPQPVEEQEPSVQADTACVSPNESAQYGGNVTSLDAWRRKAA